MTKSIYNCVLLSVKSLPCLSNPLCNKNSTVFNSVLPCLLLFKIVVVVSVFILFKILFDDLVN